MDSLQYVFRVQNALNPIEVLAVDRDAREVVLHDHVERSLESSLHLDGDDVRARHHDLADDGIAEFEDRVDYFPLGLFDAALLVPDLGHRPDVLLGDEWALLQALAGQEYIGEPDQQARREGECAPECPHDGSHGERSAVAVKDTVGLRHCLDDDEVGERERHRDERDADVGEVVLGDERNQDGGPVLYEHDREVDRVQIRSGVALDLFEEGDPAPYLNSIDRKSTRLNSSHVSISYAVFCLKKKTTISLPMLLILLL